MTEKFNEQQLSERALLSVLKDWPLKPGQMLLMGPKSVAKLSVVGAYDGHLPDTMVLERQEWDPRDV